MAVSPPWVLVAPLGLGNVQSMERCVATRFGGCLIARPDRKHLNPKFAETKKTTIATEKPIAKTTIAWEQKRAANARFMT